MIYRPEMLDLLSAAVSSWDGTVYRHMFASQPPTRANMGGARWNEPNLAAIYTSCERETALAEAEYYTCGLMNDVLPCRGYPLTPMFAATWRGGHR